MTTELGRSFNSSLEHLFAELTRVDLKLRIQVLQASTRDSYWERDELRGLYVSDRELSDLVNTGFNPGQSSASTIKTDPGYQSLLQVMEEREREIELGKAESIHNGIVLRLERLVDMFFLSTFEKDVLLLCLLPELDLKYEKLFGYIQDDVTRKRPTVALSLEILCSSLQNRLLKRRVFSVESSLLRHRLITIDDNAPGRQASLLAKSLRIDSRVCDYLLGSDEIDSSLLPFVNKIAPRKTLDDIVLSGDIKRRLSRLTDVHSNEHYSLTWYFYGAVGTGKRSTAEALCNKLGIGLLIVDANLMLQTGIPFEIAVGLLHREAMMQNSALYWDNFNALFADGLALQLNIAASQIENHCGLVFFAGNKLTDIKVDWLNRTVIPVEFPVPDYGQREQLWRIYLNGQAEALGGTVRDLAGKFQLSGGQISGAISTARNLAMWNGCGVITADELHHSCRRRSNEKLGELARKIEPKYVWNDIVLPHDQFEQLRDVCNYVKYRPLVYEEWGFYQKLSLGKGLNVLFAGPSGTGKTMAAEIIANELGLDLYKIDLAMVVSKYIGETEKNLDRIFKEAQDSNSILFFDEADAVFGKRSEVRDSHDRYANIEIAYLLQRMEEYQGIVILATNFYKNLDEAFARRMHFSVEFPLPEEEDRYRIWQRAFPGAAPLSGDVDLIFMARQFRITGGNIKNIALSAAFLAADNGGSITMESLIHATKREYQKIGRLCTEGDFDRYFELIKS